MRHLLSHLRPAIAVFAALTLITGVLYPLLMLGLARVLPAPAPSSLIGQEFSRPDFFWGRLSATGPAPYTAFDATALTGSSGSNLAPTNPALITAVQARLDALAKADAAVGVTRPAGARVPVDLVTASGSGLDPHLSPAGIEAQVARVAKARGADEAKVRDLVRRMTTPRQLGVLGEPVVPVVELNRALDREFPRASGRLPTD